jgi:protein SCO1/2
MAVNRSRRRLTLAVLVAAGVLMACERPAAPAVAPPAALRGVDITGADYARTLELTDQFGKRRSLGEFKGKAVVVFFGYTQCPDVCPTTMAELSQAKRLLGADGERVQGIFVSVDPERDTPVVLKDYLAAFDPSFVGLRGSIDETKAAAKEFKVFFAKVPGRTEGSYTIDHTAGAYLFDPAGRVRVFARHGSGAEALAADLKALLAAAST